jgi:prepilin-type N-terminal cleavage/methylation domain-containing protein
MKVSNRSSRSLGFTLMEILVVIAIIVVLAAIAFPIYGRIKSKANMGHATNIMRQLGSAVGAYAAQNNGELPAEDTKGKDDWQVIGQPEADKAWYNSLPKVMNAKPWAISLANGEKLLSTLGRTCCSSPARSIPKGKRWRGLISQLRSMAGFSARIRTGRKPRFG